MSEKVKPIKSKSLNFGEAYRTTKKSFWSIHNRNFTKIPVPVDELLIFRSFLPVKGKLGTILALFVWLKENKTICLSVSGEDCMFYLKHVNWEDRHVSLETNEVVSDKKELLN